MEGDFVSFYDNFKYICDNRGISMTKVLNTLGLSAGSINNWKNGAWPNSNIVISLAKYFDISTDEILFGFTENTNNRTKHISSYLSTMNDSDFDLLICIAKEIINHRNN